MRVWIIRAVLVIMFFGIIASEGLARRTYLLFQILLITLKI